MKAENKLKFKVQSNKFRTKVDQAYSVREQTLRSKKPNRRAFILRAFVVFLLCFAFLFGVFNFNYLTPYKMKEHMRAVFANIGKGEGFPYRFSSNDVLNFFEFNGNDYAILTKSELVILNASANPVLRYTHSMSNPIAKYSRDRILLFDQGSTKAVILNQSGQIIVFPNDNKIINGDISNSGKCVLAMNTASNKQEVQVYSAQGKKMMRWEKGSGYIIDTAINAGGSSVSVCLLDTVDAVRTVNIISFTVSSAMQKGHTTLKDATPYGIDYLNANDLAVLCAGSVTVLNAKCVVKNECELPTAKGTQLFTDASGHIVHAYSLYNNGKYTVDVYNASLKKLYTKECDGEVRDVNCNANSLCVLFENNRAELNQLGGKVTYSSTFDSEYSFILSKGKMLYVCSSGIVERAKAVKQ